MHFKNNKERQNKKSFWAENCIWIIKKKLHKLEFFSIAFSKETVGCLPSPPLLRYLLLKMGIDALSLFDRLDTIMLVMYASSGAGDIGMGV